MKIVLNFTNKEAEGIKALVEKAEGVSSHQGGAAELRDKAGVNKHIKSCEYNPDTDSVDVVLEWAPGMIVEMLDIIKDNVPEICMLYKHGRRLFKSYVDFIVDVVNVGGGLGRKLKSVISKYKE